MAESYFELLTELQRFPAKPFDPLSELKHLRRRLALRLQNAERLEETGLPPSFQEQAGTNTIPRSESTSLEAIVKQVVGMKTALAIWQRSRFRSRSQRTGIFRGHRKLWNKRHIPYKVIQHLNAPQEERLETVNASLTALGIIGVVFGILSFCRGWESDLSLGSLVCAAGAAIVAIGIGGHFLAAHADPS